MRVVQDGDRFLYLVPDDVYRIGMVDVFTVPDTVQGFILHQILFQEGYVSDIRLTPAGPPTQSDMFALEGRILGGPRDRLSVSGVLRAIAAREKGGKLPRRIRQFLSEGGDR